MLLWGSVAAGKSGVLGALYDLRLASAEAPVWSLSPGDAAPQVTEHLVSLRNGLLEGRPNPTPILPHYPLLDLVVRKRRAARTIARMQLSFVDPAGEFADNVQRLRDSGSELLERMLDARGVIWLFDVTRPGADHDAIFGQLTTLTGLTNGELVQTPIALCLSKIDLLEPAALEAAQRDPERALRNHIGEDNYRLFTCVFPVRTCFAISSRGTTPDMIQPLNLNGVFDWIYQGERNRWLLAKLANGRRTAVRAVAGLALLSLGGWGMAGAYSGIKHQREERERELLGRLERAGVDYRSGNYESVMELLAEDRLAREHPRALEWDTLFLFAAANRSVRARVADEPDSRPFKTLRERADRVLEGALLRDPQAMARIRFVRALACDALRCGRREQRTDLQYVIEHTRDRAMRRKARAALADLE